MKESAGFVDGKHFTEYVDEVKRLRRDTKSDEAIGLLLKLVDATEADSIVNGCGVAPWYYEQLAICYRKLGRLNDEIRILERFSQQRHAPGVQPPKLLARLQNGVCQDSCRLN